MYNNLIGWHECLVWKKMFYLPDIITISIGDVLLVDAFCRVDICDFCVSIIELAGFERSLILRKQRLSKWRSSVLFLREYAIELRRHSFIGLGLVFLCCFEFGTSFWLQTFWLVLLYNILLLMPMHVCGWHFAFTGCTLFILWRLDFCWKNC